MLTLLLLTACSSGAPPLEDGPGTVVARVENPALTESSGLAISSRQGVFWTHNDSGGDPELFAFDATGGMVGTWTVSGANAIDWEEVAGFESAEQRFLLVADTGDNKRLRSELQLYLVEEPDLGSTSRTVSPTRTLRIRYPDGAHDCEGLAVDPARKEALLVTKDRDDGTRAYSLTLASPQAQILTAQPVTTLELAPEGDMSGRRVTAADLSPDGTRLVLLTYTFAWEYERKPGEPWADTLARTPRKIELPALEQREAIAYGPDSKTLYLTSEGQPMPLVSIP